MARQDDPSTTLEFATDERRLRTDVVNIVNIRFEYIVIDRFFTSISSTGVLIQQEFLQF